MPPIRSASDDVVDEALRVLFVSASSEPTDLFAEVSGGRGVEVFSTDLAGVEAAVERHRPDVLVSDLDEVGDDAFDVLERVRARADAAGDVVFAIAVGDERRDPDLAIAAGYESYCSRASVASEVAGLAGGPRDVDPALARASSFVEKQVELRHRLDGRRAKLIEQHRRLARTQERLDEMARPIARALVSAPSEELGPTSNRLLSRLPGAELERLWPHLALVRLSAGKTLYWEGAAVDAAYFPVTSVVSQATVTRGGKLFEAASIGNEGMVGLGTALETGRSLAWTRVQISGAAVRIPAPALASALDDCPEFRHALLAYAQVRLFELIHAAMCNRLHRVEAQLARLLLTTSDRVRSVELPLTHERLSEALGTTRPSVTIAAQALQDAGAIVRSYGRIRIVDAERLRAAACECYETIREEFDRLARPAAVAPRA